MSVSIRLAQFGKKNAPSFRVVVTKTRSKRDGSFIDIIGHYNPSDPAQPFVVDKKVYEEWVGKGAIASEAVKQLIEGKYEFKKYSPKKAAGKDKREQAPAAKDEPVADEAPEGDAPVENSPEESPAE